MATAGRSISGGNMERSLFSGTSRMLVPEMRLVDVVGALEEDLPLHRFDQASGIANYTPVDFAGFEGSTA